MRVGVDGITPTPTTRNLRARTPTAVTNTIRPVQFLFVRALSTPVMRRPDQILNPKGSNPSHAYFCRLVSSNSKVLASSETYVNKADAVSATNSVKANAGTAPVDDLT